MILVVMEDSETALQLLKTQQLFVLQNWERFRRQIFLFYNYGE